MEKHDVSTKAAAIPLEILEGKLAQTHVHDRNIRALMRNKEFCELSFRNDQIIFMKEFMLEFQNMSLNNKNLGYIFDLKPNRVSNILRKAKKRKLKNGGQFSLTKEDENWLIQHIIEQSEKDEFLSKKEILFTASDKCGKPLTKGWLQSFLSRNCEKICVAEALPQESNLFDVPQQYLNEYILLLHHYVKNINPELLLKLDEVGISDWEWRKKKKVVISTKMKQEHSLHFKINRSIRHTSLLA
ncbi:hypothetical protein TRFO_22368 [Tritrichomonas foetus]|uniref:Uncharacterized protein n=1 Tax=Tritrichomonas foetus TaxID=1144522 RepID=A0A1J4KC05_9EUKA|nr:hypothetical protein TRFO_22368 [Tritrichomonas foetus]|eukprot:OHT08943.1 hypothetical protein TRFO_22368 [Tritrichomonas foetus]